MKRKHIVSRVILVVIIMCGFVYLGNLNSRLSEKKIMQLRDKYPICGINVPEMATMSKLSVEEKINNGTIESFVYGEVVGEISTYTKEISTGNPEFDEKLIQMGVGITYDFYEYKISVIEDVSGKYSKGDIITISANMIFMDYNPILSDGMKVVVPVMENEDKENRNWFTVTGMYYVTENGYAISAYEENSLASTVYSGLRVNALLANLKELIG